jgi:hypothetical protein
MRKKRKKESTELTSGNGFNLEGKKKFIERKKERNRGMGARPGAQQGASRTSWRKSIITGLTMMLIFLLAVETRAVTATVGKFSSQRNAEGQGRSGGTRRGRTSSLEQEVIANGSQRAEQGDYLKAHVDLQLPKVRKRSELITGKVRSLGCSDDPKGVGAEEFGRFFLWTVLLREFSSLAEEELKQFGQDQFIFLLPVETRMLQSGSCSAEHFFAASTDRMLTNMPNRTTGENLWRHAKGAGFPARTGRHCAELGLTAQGREAGGDECSGQLAPSHRTGGCAGNGSELGLATSGRKSQAEGDFSLQDRRILFDGRQTIAYIHQWTSKGMSEESRGAKEYGRDGERCTFPWVHVRCTGNSSENVCLVHSWFLIYHSNVFPFFAEWQAEGYINEQAVIGRAGQDHKGGWWVSSACKDRHYAEFRAEGHVREQSAVGDPAHILTGCWFVSWAQKGMHYAELRMEGYSNEQAVVVCAGYVHKRSWVVSSARSLHDAELRTEVFSNEQMMVVGAGSAHNGEFVVSAARKGMHFADWRAEDVVNKYAVVVCAGLSVSSARGMDYAELHAEGYVNELVVVVGADRVSRNNGGLSFSLARKGMHYAQFVCAGMLVSSARGMNYAELHSEGYVNELVVVVGADRVSRNN